VVLNAEKKFSSAKGCRLLQGQGIAEIKAKKVWKEWSGRNWKELV
jgi:hypothetical protein